MVAENDQAAKAIWGGTGPLSRKLESGIGSGRKNTEIIVEEASWYENTSLFSKTKKPYPTAARICYELSLNGFKDWFLPSNDELKILLNAKFDKKIKCMTHIDYWSSTEEDSNRACCRWFEKASKSETLSVRAICAF